MSEIECNLIFEIGRVRDFGRRERRAFDRRGSCALGTLKVCRSDKSETSERSE
jgi:hypothetical protein